MHQTPLTQIITLKNLKQAYAYVSKTSVGLDKVSVELFEEDLVSSLQEIVDDIQRRHYTPEPMSRIYVPKEQSVELRPLGLGSLKDKIVQKTIAMELSHHLDKEFSDKSYGYRANKGTLKVPTALVVGVNLRHYHLQDILSKNRRANDSYRWIKQNQTISN